MIISESPTRILTVNPRDKGVNLVSVHPHEDPERVRVKSIFLNREEATKLCNSIVSMLDES